MAQKFPDTYRFDPDDPRAPSQEQWARMTSEEHARVLASLPAQVPLDLQPPEGDAHFDAKARARLTLEAFFKRIGRKIYLSSELAVFYPNEPRFSPDLLAVLDVEPFDRDKWVVAAEGKGLDLVLEVHYAGHKAKDYDENVVRYARLGIREYFLFDRRTLSLRGYRLPPIEAGASPSGRVYRPILPQGGLFPSEVLGLDLTIEGSRLRFFYGMAPVPEAEELIGKLQSMVDALLVRSEEAEQRAQALEQQLVEGLRKGIESLCEVLSIELSPAQRAYLMTLDAQGLDALLTELRRDRRFPVVGDVDDQGVRSR